MPLFGPPNVKKMEARKDIQGLIKALGYEGDFKVRWSAAEALGQIGDPYSMEPLIAALEDNDCSLRKRAAKALGQVGDARAVNPLIGALENKDKEVRLAAVESLGQIGDVRAVEPLITVRSQDFEGPIRLAAEEALVKIGAPAVESLIAALESHMADRYTAASALGKIGDARAVEPLLVALETSRNYDHVVIAIVQALGQIGDARAIEPIITVLDKKYQNEWVRKAAADALAKLDWKPNQGKKGSFLHESEDAKAQVESLLLGLPVVNEENISTYREKIIIAESHPPMYFGSTNETIDFVTRMTAKTEKYIMSCEGISRVETRFFTNSYRVGENILEIQYQQFWNNGTSSVYSEHVMRIGEDQFEVFGSAMSANRMRST